MRPVPGVRRLPAVPRRLQPALPLVAAAVIAVLDSVAALRSWPVPMDALLDEPAHLLTAWLVLRALPGRGGPDRFVGWALVGSVLIDLDHLPLFLGDPDFLVRDSRPPTHSLLLAVALLVVALPARRRRWRLPVAGLGAGVALHLLRDVATGPGAPVLWPLGAEVLRVPYLGYAAVVAVTAVLATRLRPGLAAARGHRAASVPGHRPSSAGPSTPASRSE